LATLVKPLDTPALETQTDRKQLSPKTNHEHTRLIVERRPAPNSADRIRPRLLPLRGCAAASAEGLAARSDGHSALISACWAWGGVKSGFCDESRAVSGGALC
jgi:hypothetical protein